MNHLDLFSGIGGFALAAKWVWGDEHNIVSFVEIDPFCQKVLKKHWPDVPCHEDIRILDYEKIMAYTTSTRLQTKGRKKAQQGIYANSSSQAKRWAPSEPKTKINLLTGGFPCQSFSVAGKRRGKADDRYLWPEMFRIIRECRPDWIIGENVAGIINMALDTVLSDMEDEGYTTESFIIPACAVDAPHRRDRVWIVANNDRKRQQGERIQLCRERQKEVSEINGASEDVADTKRILSQGCEERPEQEQFRGKSGWLIEPDVGRVAHGIPSRVDRLKSLGNAIVPQVVVPIMQTIKDIDEG